MTENEEAATDAQWSQAEADRIFYARGFPLADYEESDDE